MLTHDQTVEHLIGGRRVSRGEGPGRAVLSPVTGDVIGHMPCATAEDVAAAVAAARAAQPAWEAAGAWERSRACLTIADAIERRKESLAMAITLEQGKPYHAEALDEAQDCADLFRQHAEDIKRMETSVVPLEDTGKRLMTFRRAVGTFALVTPWNFPMLIPTELLAPAIVAGNTVVLKPSESTPLSAAALVAAIQEADLPPGVVNVVYGDGGTGERLVTSDVDGVAFVGSHPVAERIVRAAGLKRTVIEASGNGPVVVLPDADLERAALGAVYGGFYCSGQVCCATERVIVHREVHDAFVEAVLREARKWPLGDPREQETLVGPLATASTAEKMDRHVEDAVAKGATVLMGGRREQGRPTDLYWQPTVIDGVSTDTHIHGEETFGPIVPIMLASSDDEALAMRNDTHLGLQTAVYTSSLDRAFRFGEALRSGTVIVNDSTDWWENHSPFGGAAGTLTGWGRVGGRHSIESMTDVRGVVLDVSPPPGRRAA